MTLAERIQKLPNLQYKISTGDADAIQELKDLYKQALGKTMQRDCGSCRIRAYQELINSSLQKIEIMSNQKYKFVDDDALVYFDHAHYTKSNITDEVVEAMVKANPVNADLFHPKPEVKEKAAKKADEPKAKKADEPNTDQPQA